MRVRLGSWEKLINTNIFLKKKIKKSGNLDWEIGAPTKLGLKTPFCLIYSIDM